MKIDSAEWNAGKLILSTSDPEALRFAIGFEAGDYQIEKTKKKRSLDANAYCWTLCSRIASALHISKNEVYRNAIRDIGGNSETYCMQKKAVDMFKKCWTMNGIGWQVETFPSKLTGCVNVTAYYGSSVYDSKQMAVLIDHLKQDCYSLGIEVEPDERIKSLLEEWDKNG